MYCYVVPSRAPAGGRREDRGEEHLHCDSPQCPEMAQKLHPDTEHQTDTAGKSALELTTANSLQPLGQKGTRVLNGERRLRAAHNTIYLFQDCFHLGNFSTLVIQL